MHIPIMSILSHPSTSAHRGLVFISVHQYPIHVHRSLINPIIQTAYLTSAGIGSNARMGPSLLMQPAAFNCVDMSAAVLHFRDGSQGETAHLEPPVLVNQQVRRLQVTMDDGRVAQVQVQHALQQHISRDSCQNPSSLSSLSCKGAALVTGHCAEMQK